MEFTSIKNLKNRIPNKESRIRKTAMILLLIMVWDIVHPISAWALTGGPSQPEVQSFEPVGTTEMVDLFTGDFNYNIPLLDVEGYPVNISYHAGISMDQEASWVGLGWNINPGVINRNVRGLPDDFKGEGITQKFTMQDNKTFGITATLGVEYAGKEGGTDYSEVINSGKSKKQIGLSLSFGINSNNYKGLGYELALAPVVSLTGKNNIRYNAGLSLAASSDGGFSTTPQVGMAFGIHSAKSKGENNSTSSALNISVSQSVNSRGGLQNINASVTPSLSFNKKDAKIKVKGVETTQDASYRIVAGLSSSYSFAKPAFSPDITMPFKTSALYFSAKAGTEIKYVYGTAQLSGYYNEQSLYEKEQTKPSFGYLYHQHKSGPDVILDFGRDKDGSYAPGVTRNLPITNFSYDQFGVSGQGVAGSYRLMRGDFAWVHDDQGSTKSQSFRAGLEAGFGDLWKGGVDITSGRVFSSSGGWYPDAGLLKYINYAESSPYREYEPAYFKAVGERNVIDHDFFSSLKEEQAMAAHINELTRSFDAMTAMQVKERYTPEMDKVNLQEIINYGKNKGYKMLRGKRDQRNQLMSYLTGEEAASVGLEQEVKSRGVSPFTGKDTTFFSYERTFSGARSHHLSEVTINTMDGRRYVYGIPAYNLSKYELTFSVPGNGNCFNGQINYGNSAVASEANNVEPNRYFSEKHTPAYAHAYLLTGVLSADYIDRSGDGISNDDFGNAYKFSYQRKDADYHWRVPYNQNTASYNEGFKTIRNDQTGSVIYGSKEIWHLSMIESRNFVAVFYTSQREDGLGTTGKDGGINYDDRSYKLDSIALYAREDFRTKGAFKAVPIKTVHFEYDYSLCQQSDNSVVSGTNPNKGKLTLRKIYFTYGHSNKGKYNAYHFNYCHEEDGQDINNSDYNPDYNFKDYDRWGNFKRSLDCTLDANKLTNADFPYVNQSKLEADTFAQVWCLTGIDLPSGGSINVEYESDDYAYVQDQQAARMINIIGAGETAADFTDWQYLYHNQGIGAKDDRINNYLFFRFPEGVSKTEATVARMLAGMDVMYFNFFLKLDVQETEDDNQEAKWEQVPGYVQLDKGTGQLYYGITVKDGETLGWVRVKTEPTSDRFKNTEKGKERADKASNRLHPITKIAMNYARLNIPQIVYPGSDPNATGVKGIKGLLGAISEITTLWKSFYKKLKNKQFAEEFNTARSWVRMYEPTGFKYGGGCRVKRITIMDNWDQMISNDDRQNKAIYGQEYSYKESGGSKSSGVASWEPAIGNEENPLKQPITTTQENLMAPDDRNYIEGPIGEMFYPAPVVGYSRVAIRNLQYENVRSSGTGHTSHGFYTAKDFPVISEETPIQAVNNKTGWNFLKGLLFLNMKREHTASQGYVVTVNDMHGKPKFMAEFPYGKNLDVDTGYLKRVDHYYLTKEQAGRKEPNNYVLTYDIGSNPPIAYRTIGVDFDAVIDTRKQRTRSSSGSAQANLDGSMIGVLPIPLPMVWGSRKVEFTTFQSSVITKVIFKTGIHHKTVVSDEGAIVTTENVLFDAGTGEVLLTRTQNEFNDSIFNFTYPAYFAYEGMGPAYKNIGMEFRDIVLNGVDITEVKSSGNESVSRFFHPGDEVMIQSNFSTEKSRAWVHKNPNTNHTLLLRLDGSTIKTSGEERYTVKIIRSGRRNQQAAAIGTVVSLHTPIQKINHPVEPSIFWGDIQYSALKGIINAGAVEFSDQWKTFCDQQPDDLCETPKPIATQLLGVFNEMIDSNEFTAATGETFLNYSSYQNSDFLTKACNYNQVNDYFNSTLNFCQTSQSVQFIQEADTCNCTFTLQPIGISNICYDSAYIGAIEYHFFDVQRPGDTAIIDTVIIDDLMDELDPDFGGIPLPADTIIYDEDIAIIRDTVFRFSDIAYFYGFGDLSGPCYQVNAKMRDSSTVQIKLCVSCPNVQFMENCCTHCVVEEGKLVNPYVMAMAGVWRPKAEYVYYAERNNSQSEVNIRKQGTYASFSPFWTRSGNSLFTHPADNNWVKSREVTLYSPFGFELENKDALDRYSAALYAYNRTLPVAVANNAKYSQIAYDGFEDYGYANAEQCEGRHWSFSDDANILDLSTSWKHTGLRSIQVDSMESFLVSRKILNCTESNYSIYQKDEVFTSACNCIGKFEPDTGLYVLGGWIHENRLATHANFTESAITIKLKKNCSDTGITIIAKAAGPIIEGWQRVEKTFHIPEDITIVEVYLTPGAITAWYDDLRIHPFNSNMQTFVYDPVNLRLKSTLDENNYATFYEYDQEGQLVRVKKETERGIFTIQENRSSLPKVK